MDPDKQSLHLPAFGKDKRSLRLVRSEEINTSINFFFATSHRKANFQSFLPWASLCFAYRLRPSPLFKHKQLCFYHTATPLGAVVLINALIWKSAGKITSGHIIKINR